MAERQIIDSPERRRTRRLADVLKDLMARANLKKSVLARYAGVSPATLTNLTRGHDIKKKATFPNPDLLRQIALGLSTNGLRERDLAAADEAYQELMQAIGYLDSPSLVYAPPLPEEVVEILRENPDLTIDIQQMAGGWSPQATEMLRAVLADYRARFVQRELPPGEYAQ